MESQDFPFRAFYPDWTWEAPPNKQISFERNMVSKSPEGTCFKHGSNLLVKKSNEQV